MDATNEQSQEAAYDSISAALDRFEEAHFWIHMMEQYYHSANPFRWHLNVFLKALKEVPDLIQMALQNETGFSQWFKDERVKLREDPLIDALSKHRDFVVHRSMLLPKSSGWVGMAEGRGLKHAFNVPIDPREDSDSAIYRFAELTKDNDIFGLLSPDDDSMPCVQREWRLPDFEDDLVDLCSKAWLRLGELIDAVLRWQGASPPELSLDCRHGSANISMRLYDRDQLRKHVGLPPISDLYEEE